MSVTTGVVSRIEMQEYAQAGERLLAVQIDAAINPGNSGGPVVNEELELVGVAFQSLSSEEVENIGYVVPITVVEHFLEDTRRHGGYTGFCALGIKLQHLESEAMRSYLGMASGDSGILVLGVAERMGSFGLLERGDVILEVDGVKIANDGTIPSEGDRLALQSYMANKFVEDTVSWREASEARTYAPPPSSGHACALASCAQGCC